MLSVVDDVPLDLKNDEIAISYLFVLEDNKIENWVAQLLLDDVIEI